MQRVVVSILHYENEQLTNQCIDSVLRTTSPEDVYILVVDNNSPTVYNRTDVQNMTIVRNDTHLSVPGINKGLYTALYGLGLNPDYVVNMDNDIICLDGWLQPLLDIMDTEPDVGIVGGKQWNKDKTKFNSIGADLMGMIVRNAPNHKCNVIWMQGSFHMYRSEMMRQIGLHDSRYKIICSDADYCIHANDRGWRVVFTPDSEVIHIGNASYGGVPVESEKEDKLAFMQKWLGIKFCALTRLCPFDISENHLIKAKYTVDGESTEYIVNAIPVRESTRIIKSMMGDIDITGVEVGVRCGNNAYNMLQELPNLSKLYLVDNGADGFNKRTKKRFEFNPRTEFIEKDSVEASKQFDDGSLDFVYIDADHSYDSVKSDIQAWLPKVKHGGLLCGHDYVLSPDDPTFKVVEAVNDSFPKEKIETDNIDWWVRV